jgi:hypothetical protein
VAKWTRKTSIIEKLRPFFPSNISNVSKEEKPNAKKKAADRYIFFSIKSNSHHSRISFDTSSKKTMLIKIED